VYLIASLSQTLESFADWEDGGRGEEIYVFEEEEDECEKYRRKFFII
jgi:hypothetical protein